MQNFDFFSWIVETNVKDIWELIVFFAIKRHLRIDYIFCYQKSESHQSRQRLRITQLQSSQSNRDEGPFRNVALVAIRSFCPRLQIPTTES